MASVQTVSSLALFLIGGVAYGQCPPYAATQLGEDMAAMSEALRASNSEDFQRAGGRLAEGLPCIKEPMAPVVLSSVYRYMGLHAYFRGDEAQARSWFRSALELDSTFDWDVSELPVDDPLRPIFEEERSRAGTEKVAVSDTARLNIAEGKRLAVDGRMITQPALTKDRPHLVQLIDGATNTVESVWLIEGNALPPQLVIDGGAAAVASAPSSQTTFERIERQRPPLKTPALIVGGTFMAAGVGLYAASFSTKSKFEKATTLDDAKAHRSTTNTLVIAASSAFVAGAGMTYVGFMLDSGAGLAWTGRF